MGLFSAITSGFSAVCSAVSSVVSAIGPSVAKFCQTVVPLIGPFIEKIHPVFAVLVKVGEFIFKNFSIFEKDDNLPETGDRALQAAEKNIKPENFESHAAYMQTLRDFPLDPEKSATYSDIQKLVAGLAVGTDGLEQKLDVAPGKLGPMWVLPAMSPQFFTPERLTALLNTTKDFATIVSYFEGGVTPTTARNVEGFLVSVEKQIDPAKTVDYIHQDIDAARKQAIESIKKASD